LAVESGIGYGGRRGRAGALTDLAVVAGSGWVLAYGGRAPGGVR